LDISAKPLYPVFDLLTPLFIRRRLQNISEYAAELKAKQEAEAKAKASAALKKTTITCVKGKLTKKVTAVKPKCPSGYKLKK